MAQVKWPARLYALDVSRGVAALSVVLWHWQHFAYSGTSRPGSFERDTQPLYGALKILYEAGAFGVQYFFLISGFVFFWLYREKIGTRSVSARTFFFQRFSRLYPLHFVTLILVAVLQMVFFSREGDYFVYPYNDIYHFLLNLGFASNWGLQQGWSFNAPIWSVSIEVLLYFVFFLVAYRYETSRAFCLVVAISAFLMSRIIPHFIWIPLSLFFYGGFVFYATAFFSEKLGELKLPICAFVFILWLLVFFNFYFFDFSGQYPQYKKLIASVSGLFTNYVLFPATIIGLALVEIDRGSLFRRISWIGDITYSSYMIHFPLQLIFAFLISYGFLDSDFYLNPLSLIVYFLILIPVSYLVFHKFERPVQKYLRNRF